MSRSSGRAPITRNNVAQIAALATLRGHTDTVTHIALSRDGAILASAGADKTVRVWNTTEGTTLHVFAVEANHVTISPDGSLVAIATIPILVRDTNTGSLISTLTGHPNKHLDPLPISLPKGTRALAFSPDGAYLASGGMDYYARVWHTATWAERRAFRQRLYVRAVAVSPDNTVIAVSSGGQVSPADRFDHRFALWNVTTGKRLWSKKCGVHYQENLAFSPDGRTLATDGYLWEVATKRQLHDLAARCAAFSADGGIVATCRKESHDIHLIDIQTGRELATLHGHTEPVWGLAFSGDGTLLASYSRRPTTSHISHEANAQSSAEGGDCDVRLWGIPRAQ